MGLRREPVLVVEPAVCDQDRTIASMVTSREETVNVEAEEQGVRGDRAGAVGSVRGRVQASGWCARLDGAVDRQPVASGGTVQLLAGGERLGGVVM